jgi:hypothetical protein
VLYKLQGDAEKSLHHLQRSAELDPGLAGPHFQLATAYRQAKRTDDAKREMAIFRKIKQRDAGAAVPEDLEWSYYSEIYETLDPAAASDPAPAAELKLETRVVAEGFDAASAGLAVTDADGDGRPDLLAWSKSGARLLLGGEKPSAAGLDGVKNVISLAAGDFDNDGLADLCVVTGSGVLLFENAGGKYQRHSEVSKTAYRLALWLDYDHDYDVDLVLLGDTAALWRNQGETGFAERTADFPFAAGKALDAARVDMVADAQGLDLAVVYDGKAVLYRDRLGGRYEAAPLEIPAGVRRIGAHDADHDGWTDLTVAGPDGAALLVNDRRGSFARQPIANARAPFAWADFENRGLSELVTGTGKNLYRNRGLGRLTADAAPAGWPDTSAAVAAADFDGDGRVDLAAVGADGKLRLAHNRTATGNRWLGVRLQGVKNLALAPGSEIEVKAGSRYQKKLYEGTTLHFGLGDAAEIDTVRITWPNGLIQNEARQEPGAVRSYEEAQRLSGSCPMIYAWNGEEFEFITDVLGVAPLGASAGNGEYFPVDHDEIVQIAGESLVAVDGEYRIRVVEELREVAFLDEIRLIAVDHPQSVDVFTNDKFKGPPFPELRLFGVRERHYPMAARDHRGNDVRELVSARDRRYPDGYERDYAGVAELHHLELDFGTEATGDEAILVLSGWVDWADGSTFLGASQGGGGLVMPYLQVKDAAGEWRTVIEDMGIPAGKPKTIVVDLSGRFLSASREVRIVTNLCVYWDEIFLSPDVGEPPVRLSDLHADVELRFRGFSDVVIHPERKQPERFVYARRRPLAMWNPTPGLYTRYGDVGELLRRVDDRLVVMGSGDELSLTFDATALPPVADGWRRDFLLFVDGWAKDGDANTAHSQTVGPLPYHGMPQYPYDAPHHFPDDGPHNLYREHYNTRPALRLIRPLTEGLRP